MFDNDVKACYEWLQNNGKTQKPLIIHGRSVGGGPACWGAENLVFDGEDKMTSPNFVPLDVKFGYAHQENAKRNSPYIRERVSSLDFFRVPPKTLYGMIQKQAV